MGLSLLPTPPSQVHTSWDKHQQPFERTQKERAERQKVQLSTWMHTALLSILGRRFSPSGYGLSFQFLIHPSSSASQLGLECWSDPHLSSLTVLYLNMYLNNKSRSKIKNKESWNTIKWASDLLASSRIPSKENKELDLWCTLSPEGKKKKKTHFGEGCNSGANTVDNYLSQVAAEATEIHVMCG